MRQTTFDLGDEGEAATTASVLLPLALPGPYDYLASAGLEAGSIVRVPLGPREMVGVVWGPGSDDIPSAKLKRVAEVYPAEPLNAELRSFIDWVAAYTFSPPGAVLRMALRSAALEPPAERTLLRLTEARPERMTAARARVLETASDGLARSVREIAELSDCSDAVVRGLADQGVFERIQVTTEAPFAAPDPDFAPHALSGAQAEAAASLVATVGAEGSVVTLLDGVTGSGKTEVYFEAVAEALRKGKQSLILLPEIALTSGFLERFEARFGVRPGEWHSEVGTKERTRVWRAAAAGEVQVVIGARSALFLPFQDLGLIVVDEEHDQAFKQEDGVAYHARDMSVVRGQIAGAPVVLSSATPSLESLTNVERGRYRHLVLPERHGAATLPDIAALDMRQAPPERGQWLAPPLVTAMQETLAAGEQVLLFLNRRGYAPLTLCRACGHRMQCPQCTSWLVEHRFRRELQCHHCGFSMPTPKACPQCEAEESLVPCGPGVERIAEEVLARFPEARLELMSSDNVRGASEQRAALDRIAGREVDIVIGTQIVAKGHHFPWLTLVGVVDADLGLENGDLRAGERTFQLLSQVAGRAGRAERPGRVLLQTYMPEHPVMQALVAGERDRFMAREAEQRKATGLPPFGRLVGIVVSAEDGALASRTAKELAAAAPLADGVRVLGPAPAPLALLRGRTRLRFLVKASRGVTVQDYLADWLGKVKLPNAVRLSVDVDPYSFM